MNDEDKSGGPGLGDFGSAAQLLKMVAGAKIAFWVGLILLILAVLVVFFGTPAVSEEQAELYRRSIKSVEDRTGLDLRWEEVLAVEAGLRQQMFDGVDQAAADKAAWSWVETMQESSQAVPCPESMTSLVPPPPGKEINSKVVRTFREQDGTCVQTSGEYRRRTPDEVMERAGLTAEQRELAQALLTNMEGADLLCVPPAFVPIERTMAWPTPGHTRITSCFGPRIHPVRGTPQTHGGLDIGAPEGTPVVAITDGRIATAGSDPQYGLRVAIEHSPGTWSQYGHLSTIAVTRGQKVKRGDIIGYVGSTGISTGPHLHLEWLVGADRRDPLPFYLPGRP